MRSIGTLRTSIRNNWPAVEAEKALKDAGVEFTNTGPKRKWGLLGEVRKRFASGLSVSHEWVTENGWKPGSIAPAISKLRKEGLNIAKDHANGEYFVIDRTEKVGEVVIAGDTDLLDDEDMKIVPSEHNCLICSDCEKKDREIEILYKVIERLTNA